MNYKTITTDSTLDVIDTTHGITLHIVKGRPDASGVVISIEAHTTPREQLKAYANNLKAYVREHHPSWLEHLTAQPCTMQDKRANAKQCPTDCMNAHPDCLASMLHSHYYTA